jgi:hypothetical protein
MASTNLITYSRTIAANWTAANVTATDNAVASPDGTTNASTIKEDGTTNVHGSIAPAITVANGSVYGISAYFKNVSGSRWAQLNLAGSYYINFQPSTGTIGSAAAGVSSASVRSVGGGWYRLQAQVTSGVTGAQQVRVYLAQNSSDGAAPSYAGDNTSTIAVWGVQFETAGVGVTSYIPTAGSTASRTQDVLSLPLTSLPGWSASQGGVLVAAYRLHTLVPSSPGYTQAPAAINDGSTNNVVRIEGQDGGGGRAKFFVSSGGATQAQPNIAASPAIFTWTKHAGGWSTSRIFGALNGGAGVGASGAYSLPVAPTTLSLGCTPSSQALNGTLESIAYYRGARPDAFVQAVSR